MKGDYSLGELPSFKYTGETRSVASKKSLPTEVAKAAQKSLSFTPMVLKNVDNIFNKLDTPSKLPAHFKRLDESIEQLINAMDQDPVKSTEKEAVLDSIYDKIKQNFKNIAHVDSSVAWVQRADLLDALDKLIELRSDRYQPLEVQPSSVSPTWKVGTTPLVSYSNIEDVTDKIGRESIVMNDASDVQMQLGQAAVGEHTGTAKIIRKVSGRGFKLAKVMGCLYKILTRIMGTYKDPIHFSNATNKIAKISRKLGIKSFEVLCDKATNMEKGVFYYRGPKYLFGASVHDYKSVNDWFKRAVTPEATQAYLAKARHDTALLEDSLGDLSNTTPLVISNSDARLRFEELAPGQFGQSQELSGKVLSEEALTSVSGKKDDAAYYAEKYKFTTKNLLGRESTDLMEARELPSSDRLKEDALSLKKEILPGDVRGQKQFDADKKKFLKNKKHQHVIKVAQSELLSGMYRAFEEEGAVQVIQRLAPADVHNYVAPLDGKPLSHKEAVGLLQRRLQVKQDRLEDSQGNAQEIAQIETEIEHFQQLIGIFEAQEVVLGRSSLPTIGLLGTNESVSAQAIQNQSRILAQNDRNVMLFEHTDGSFSMHVFIGATGVNKVDVDPSTESMRQGDRQGDMQFGRDRYKADGSYLAAERGTTRDGVNKLTLKAETRPFLQMGDNAGRFPIDGSTVISYYLPSDFTIKPEITAFKEKAVYGEGINRAEIEILANMGDPVLIKTEILMTKALEKAFPESFTVASSGKKDWSFNMEEMGGLSPSEQKLVDAAYDLLNKNDVDLTVSEAKLKRNLLNMLNQRWQVLQNAASLNLASSILQDIEGDAATEEEAPSDDSSLAFALKNLKDIEDALLEES